MRLRAGTKARRGMSLLEVIVALAIFLMSVIVLGRLVILAGERGREVQDLSVATQLCQSKLAEVAAGVVPLSPQSGTPFDEDPAWTWSLDCTTSDTPNLWDVTVRVSRERSDGTRVECTLSQKVLDPSIRGSTFDAWVASQNAASGTSTTGSTGSSNSTTGSSSSGGQ
jgi:general secretion pathway protein I